MSSVNIDKEQSADAIAAYLKVHENKDMLRFLTCGSVDDGKSTMIGRLLYDCHMIYEDQIAAVVKDSKVHGTTGDDFDPALFTDGLKAEREQGITIDVAYRYFSTEKRKFIIADCPGHEQYTRNMATGASGCSLAIILIDARHGVITQTRRHSFICSLLGIKHVVVAVNKMDLVDWSKEVFDKIRSDYNDFAARLGFSDMHFIPISALKGDNVVDRSAHMDWYDGPTILHHLENVNIVADVNLVDMRFPVQMVLRPDLNFRGYAGTVASGVLRKGDEIVSLPSHKRSRIKEVLNADGVLDQAFAGMAVTVTLEDEIDVSRGDVIAPVNNMPHVGREFEAMLVWMHDDCAQIGKSYHIRQSTGTSPCVLSDIRYKIDVNTMSRVEVEKGSCKMGVNEIGRCHISLHRPIAFDSYERNRLMGAFVLIDRLTNATVGAGMIIDRVVDQSGERGQASKNISRSESLVSVAEREALMKQKGCTIWLTGLSGSGKSTIAKLLERKLFDMGHPCVVLDGDNVRYGLNRDLGFSAEDRAENIRRIAEVARLFNDAGMIVITAFISPYRNDRDLARGIIDGGEDPEIRRFIEVYVDAPLDVCESRDPKGLYKKCREGKIKSFTGISDPYEVPLNAEMVLHTDETEPDQSVGFIVNYLQAEAICVDGQELIE